MATVVVTGRGGKISARDRKHAESKIDKLNKYFNGITRIEIILQKEAERTDVELVITVRRGGSIVCHSKDKDTYAAIDLVLDKAETQLTRYKEKLRHHRRGQSAAEMQAVDEKTTDEPLEAYDDIVAKRDFGIRKGSTAR